MQAIWDHEIESSPESAANWLLHGFIARRNITLLTSMWKSGKTTLLAHLLARRVTGQALLERAVVPGKSVVISEEPREHWAARRRQFAFGGQVCFFPRPFAQFPCAHEWRELIERVRSLRAAHGIDLLVVDSIGHFLRGESSAAGVAELMMPIQQLTGEGMAALLIHHPRRRDSGPGSASRGHGLIQTEADIIIEMRYAGDDPVSRARRLFCKSRHAETPTRLHFELNADGADYTMLSTAEETGLSEHWEALRMVLEEAPHKLTREQILEDWPEQYRKPCPVTMWQWLQAAVASELVRVEGNGRRSDPLRYWLPASEARWRGDPTYEMHEMMEESRKRVQALLDGKMGWR
jgi:KaiC/GvpD/RAD55 family RecA-like ATPase